MKESNWINELHRKYYHLFEVYNEEQSNSHNKAGSIIRGIEVSESWKYIVELLLEKFEWIRTHNTYMENPDYDEELYSSLQIEQSKDNKKYIPGPDHEIKIFQIKQKFGNFECYFSIKGSSVALSQCNEAVAYCSALASVTCEYCGRIGNTDGTMPSRTKRWISIKCDRCMSERNNGHEQLSFDFMATC